jgi:hypothetical protein
VAGRRDIVENTMSLGNAFLISLVAFGAQWPIIDLPYPDVDRSGGAGIPSAEAQVEEAIVRHVRLREPPAAAPRKLEVSQLRIDGTRATAVISSGERSERLRLERIDGEWRVLKAGN